MRRSSLDQANGLGACIYPEGRLIVRSTEGCITYERPRFNVILVKLAGKEQSEMGRLFFALLARELAHEQRRWRREGQGDSIHLFVDARRVSRHGLMFESWIRFLLESEHRLRRIHILATNKTIALSVQIIQHLSDTGKLVQLYETAGCFDAAQRALLPLAPSPVQLAATASRRAGQLDLSRRLPAMSGGNRAAAE